MTPRRPAPILVCLLSLATFQAAAQGSAGAVTTVDLPTGGTIAYAELAHQSTLEGGLGKVLHYVGTQYGARAQITQMVRGRGGKVLAAVYSLTSPNHEGKAFQGLALAVIRPDGAIEGAMVTDQADRFRKTFSTMLDRLSAQAGPATAPTTAADATAGAAAPAANLHQLSYPTGTVGAPAGWRITNSHAAEVSLAGPQGEVARFGMPVSAYDPANGQARVLAAGGNFVPIPRGADAAATFTAAANHLSRQARQPQPTYHFAAVKELAAPAGQRDYFLSGDADFHDGKGSYRTWIRLAIAPPMALGAYQMTISQIIAPVSVADAEEKTLTGMFGAYRPNFAAAASQVGAETARDQRSFNESMRQTAGLIDSGDRMTAGMSDLLRGNTVVRDRVLNGHGRVDDDVADGLVESDPNRFEKVPLSQYVRGIDY